MKIESKAEGAWPSTARVSFSKEELESFMRNSRQLGKSTLVAEELLRQYRVKRVGNRSQRRQGLKAQR